MLYIGILTGITITLIATQALAVILNRRDRAKAINYQERTLAALERRNEIGEEMVEALRCKL